MLTNRKEGPLYQPDQEEQILSSPGMLGTLAREIGRKGHLLHTTKDGNIGSISTDLLPLPIHEVSAEEKHWREVAELANIPEDEKSKARLEAGVAAWCFLSGVLVNFMFSSGGLSKATRGISSGPLLKLTLLRWSGLRRTLGTFWVMIVLRSR